MRSFVIVLAFAIAASGAQADDRAAVLGVWGTAEQCARAPLIPGGTVNAAPFEIGEEWLQHGDFWCQLSWFPSERRPDGMFTGAFARCGEDAVRSYLLGMELAGDRLTLRWDVFRSNGPLSRCDAR